MQNLQTSAIHHPFELADSVLDQLGEPGAALWRYWSSLPRDGVVPDRAAFDPMAIARTLPIVSLMEHEGPSTWRVRLAGTSIEARSGRSFTGVNFLDMLAPELRQDVDRRLRRLVEQPCGAVVMRSNLRASGALYAIRTVMLPLHDARRRATLLVATNEQMELASGPRPADKFEALKVFRGQLFDIGAGLPAQAEA